MRLTVPSRLSVPLGITAGLLMMAGSATAAEGPDPVLSGSCATTVRAGAGPALTVDAGALADMPGRVTIALGGASTGTKPGPRALLTLPVTDTLRDGTPRATRAAVAELCAAAKPLVNELGALVQHAVPIDEPHTEPAPSAQHVQFRPQEQPRPGAPTANGESVTGFDNAGTGTSAHQPSSHGGLLPGTTVGLLPERHSTTPVPAGSYEPLPYTRDIASAPETDDEAARRVNGFRLPTGFGSGEQRERLPLVLAVLTLAGVATLLARRFQHSAVPR